MVLAPTTRSEGKRSLPEPWLYILVPRTRGMASGGCLHQRFGAKTHGEGKRPLTSPCALGAKGMVKASFWHPNHGESNSRLPSHCVLGTNVTKSIVRATAAFLHRALLAAKLVFFWHQTPCRMQRPLAFTASFFGTKSMVKATAAWSSPFVEGTKPW